jgi:AcrR family transcriptional regulator
MGIIERKNRERQQRIKSILKVAEKIFLVKGVDGIIIDDVAREAELSKGAIYLYFNSKGELIAALLFQIMNKLYNMFNNQFGEKSKGIEKISDLVKIYFNFFYKNPHYFELLINHEIHESASKKPGPFAEKCRKIALSLWGIVAEAVKIGQKDGTIRSNCKPVLVAVILSGQLNGIIALLIRERENFNNSLPILVNDITKMSFDLFINGLRPR